MALNRTFGGLIALQMVIGSSIIQADETPSQNFADALTEAQQLMQRSAEAGHEWLATAALLEDARALAASGELSSAWRALEQGRLQAKMSLAQAEREAAAWQQRVLR